MKHQIVAPVGGTLSQIFDIDGQTVIALQEVGTIEVMKTEWGINSPVTGIIKWLVHRGEFVEEDQVIAEVEI